MQEKPASEFYFAIDTSDYDATIVVIYRKTWDAEKRWDDDPENMATERVNALGYIDLTECVHEIPDDDCEGARQVMVDAGFIENDNILS